MPATEGLTAAEAQRPLAVYFSEFALDESRKDYYSRLIRYLRWIELLEIAFFSTLNYECLLEQALENEGIGINYLIDEARSVLDATSGPAGPRLQWSARRVNVAKLHGSCNSYFPADQNVAAQLSTGAMVETRIDISGARTSLSETSVAGRYPIMSQVSRDREDYLGPAKILQLRQMWAQVISDARLIIVIGLAPRRYDRHIWNPLQHATADIVYIGSDSDASSWLDCNPRFRSLGSTFDRGFRPLLRTLARARRDRGGTVVNYLLDLCRSAVA